MLNQDRVIIFILLVCLLYGCSQTSQNNLHSKEESYKEKTIGVLGTERDYLDLHFTMTDSLTNWYSNNLLPDTANDQSTHFKQVIARYMIDSIYVVNSQKNKLMGTIYQIQDGDVEIWSDEMREFFGAKIDGKWYFWMGASTPIIRTGLKGHDLTKPLPYSYLHKMGVGSLGGYLDKDGNIRDEWFEAKFKSGHYSFSQRYMYKHILDGQRIDNEKEYWEYIWEKKGTMLWKRKAYQDSITKMKQENIQ